MRVGHVISVHNACNLQNSTKLIKIFGTPFDITVMHLLQNADRMLRVHDA